MPDERGCPWLSAGRPTPPKGSFEPGVGAPVPTWPDTFGPVHQIQLAPTQALEGLRDQALGSHFDRLMHRFAKVARSWSGEHLLKQLLTELLTTQVPTRFKLPELFR